MSFYKGKNVLVTGGTGLIGVPLVTKLLDAGAYVTIASADSVSRFSHIKCKVKQFLNAEYIKCDLTNYDECYNAIRDSEANFVFQLAGSKGSNAIGVSRGATFFDSHMRINMNMLKCSKKLNVEKYLLTSTVGVYAPGSTFIESTMWEGLPNSGDKYSAWAKRMAELQTEAYRDEYGWKGIVIVRPGSCYGPWDNFDTNTTMVVGSLINKISENKSVDIHNPNMIRDFTFSDDVADGMLLALENSGDCEAFNIGSGTGYEIIFLAEAIAESFGESYLDNLKIIFHSKFGARVLNIDKARNILGFNPSTNLKDGIGKTVAWFKDNQNVVHNRYNVFTYEEIMDSKLVKY